MSDSNEVALSIEETNRLRISLGLKPLALPGSAPAPEDKDEVARKNFEQHKEKLKQEADAAELAKRIEKARTKRLADKKLKGKTLGDAEFEDLAAKAETNTRDWVVNMRQKEKERQTALRKAKELEELDQSVTRNYTSSDLKGLRVTHDLSEFDENAEGILVLEDKNVLDEDGDALTSVAVAEQAKAKKNIENRMKKTAYSALDENELENPGQTRILSQYDEEIDGPKRRGFVLGGDAEFSSMDDPEEQRKRIAEELKKEVIRLDFQKTTQSDYYTQEELVSFKKPAKTKKKKLRKKEEGEDLKPEVKSDPDGMDVDAAAAQAPLMPPPQAPMSDDANYVDDDDLAAALARTRRMALKKNKPRSMVDMLASLEEGKRVKEENEDEIDEESKPEGLVLSSTSEFVRNLSNVPSFLQNRAERPANVAGSEVKRGDSVPIVKKEEDVSDDEDMMVVRSRDVSETPSAARSMSIKEEDEEEEGELKEEVKKLNVDLTAPAGLEEEPLVGQGLAATLKLLQHKGLVRKTDEEQLKADRLGLDNLKWRKEQALRDAQKKREKEKEKQERIAAQQNQKGKSAAEREREERERERDEQRKERERMREVEQKFSNYKPDVKLEYFDETGRKLTQKEEYKRLSHKFHGKGPGLNKIDYQKKKLEEQARVERLNAADSFMGGTAEALKERQKSTGEAFVVLTVGNRAVMPTAPISRGGNDAGAATVASSSSKPTVVVPLAKPEARDKVQIQFSAGVKRKLVDDGANSVAKKLKDDE